MSGNNGFNNIINEKANWWLSGKVGGGGSPCLQPGARANLGMSSGHQLLD